MNVRLPVDSIVMLPGITVKSTALSPVTVTPVTCNVAALSFLTTNVFCDVYPTTVESIASDVGVTVTPGACIGVGVVVPPPVVSVPVV